MWIIDIAKVMGRIVVPAKVPGEDDAMFVWRQSVGITMALLTAALITMNILTFGIYPGMYTGFVTNAQFAVQSETLKDLRLEQIRRTIDDLRVKQCLAIMEGNIDSMRLAYQNLQQQVDQYLTVAGRSYRVPECNELIATVQTPIPAPTPIPQKVLPPSPPK